MSSTATLPQWDLSALFSSKDDPKIEQTWSEAKSRAESFAKQYRGTINHSDLTASRLLEAIVEVESISVLMSKAVGYAHLLFASDSSKPENGAFLQKQMEKATGLNVMLMFFELEIQAMPGEWIEKLLQDPILAGYKHSIHVTRAYSDHRLSEAEEVILEETANTGIRAWNRLFDEVTSNHTYRMTMPSGETEQLSQEEVLDYFRHPDRAVRQAAADAFTEGLSVLQRVLVFTYNTILLDKGVGDRLRNYGYPEQARHQSNELDKETVDLVIQLCRENYGLVSRFYKVKQQILGLDELTHIDRYAPLFEAEEEVTWDRSRDIVLEAFGQFSSVLAEKGKEFFDKNWIDAEPRKGKHGGAFCSYNTPDTHPVLLQSFLGKMDDVMTLAHELGHGVHASLSRKQTYFNFHGTLPLAELASTFGEMLVFEKLTSQANLKDKLALYAEKVEGIFATVFRQAAMFQFEQEAHNRRKEGELTAEELGEIWQTKLQEMFGDSVRLGEQHKYWWSYVSHFYGSPFYVYAYSFGELLVLSLYQMSKAEGPSFADKYIGLLELGGSQSPAELMALVNVDLQSEEFWRGGFSAMERLVEIFESLWGEFRTN